MAEKLSDSVIRKAQVIIIDCQLCQKTPSLKWKCTNCEIFMCNNCKVNVHAKFKSDKIHNVIDIKDPKFLGLSIQPTVDLGHIPCKEHEKQFCCVHCVTCEKLICPKCLTSSHKGHDVADIETTYDERLEYLRNHGTTNFNPRAMTFLFGSLEELKLSCQSKDITIKIVQKYDTAVPSFNRHVSQGTDSIWISSLRKNLRLYEFETGSTLSFKNEYTDVVVYDFAISSKGTLLFTKYNDTRLFNFLDEKNGKMKVVCDFHPFLPRAVLAKNDTIIVSTKDQGIAFPLNRESRRQLVILDECGSERQIIETDIQNERMFSLVYRIAVNIENDIVVVDGISGSTGRIVCLRNNTIKWTYEGNPDINNEQNLFNPLDIVTTSTGNIIVADEKNNALHVLSNAGAVLKCWRTTDVNIVFPISLDIDSNGRLLVGCRRDSKIYVLEMTGC
ncbi:uncharacterized protein LOC134690447 [Mytilus trossulus]|uniref:uncharacterized protein LOC134690447 n=1 Tax=Mytilus trossulus TaxID=6551 RepID=UPI003007A878